MQIQEQNNIIHDTSNKDTNSASKLQIINSNNRTFLSILIIFGVCFVSVIFVFQIILTPIAIDGISMQPTINNSYSAYTNNDAQDIVYYLDSNDYQNGDIVIIDNKLENDTLIKRVIATGGQTITFNVILGTEKYETIKGKSELVSMAMTISISDNTGSTLLDENYIKEPMQFEFITELNSSLIGKYTKYQEMDQALRQNYTYSVIVPENSFYCLGDNRNASYDSRCYGTFVASDIKGEVVLHVPHGKSIFYAIWNKIFG